MSRVFALGVGALAAGAALFAAPANAQVVVGYGVESPGYYDYGYSYGYAPVGYYGGYSYNEYAAPELRALPGGGVVATRIVQRSPDVRVPIATYPAASYSVETYPVASYPAVMPVANRRVVTTYRSYAPGYVGTPAYYAPSYAEPELRVAPDGGVVRTRIVQRSPTVRAVVDSRGHVIRPAYY